MLSLKAESVHHEDVMYSTALGILGVFSFSNFLLKILSAIGFH